MSNAVYHKAQSLVLKFLLSHFLNDISFTSYADDVNTIASNFWPNEILINSVNNEMQTIRPIIGLKPISCL